MAQAPTFMSGLSNFFGGGQQQPGGQQPHEPQFDDEPIEENQEPGAADLIGDMFTPPEDEEDEDGIQQPGPQLGPDGKPLPTPQQKLAATIQEAISKIGTPALPDNFDPSDTKQLTDFMAQSNQATALAAIQLTFQPMQMAMEEQMNRIQTMIESKLSGFGSQQSESTILKEIVPEVEDDKLGGLVQTLFKQAKQSKAGKDNPKAAAQMVRKGLDAMGFKATKTADPLAGGSGFRTGKDALDAYAPLRAPNPQRRQQNNNGGGN